MPPGETKLYPSAFVDTLLPSSPKLDNIAGAPITTCASAMPANAVAAELPRTLDVVSALLEVSERRHGH